MLFLNPDEFSGSDRNVGSQPLDTQPDPRIDFMRNPPDRRSGQVRARWAPGARVRPGAA